MIEAGSLSFLVVSQQEHVQQFQDFLGDGSQWGIRITYSAQLRPLGIADGLLTAREFAGSERCALILGDNIFLGEDTPYRIAEAWRTGQPTLFLHEVADPSHYGVAVLVDGRLADIEEKPQNPKSDLAVTGIYLYDDRLFDHLATIEKSERGELEVTDLNRAYLAAGDLNAVVLPGESSWFDGGKPKTLLRAANQVAHLEDLRGHPVGCPFFSSWRSGRVRSDSVIASIGPLEGSEYADLLAAAIRTMPT